MGLNRASAKEDSSSEEPSPALVAVNHVPTSAVWRMQEAARRRGSLWRLSPQRSGDVVQSPNTRAEWQTSTSTDTGQAGLPEICLDRQMGTWGEGGLISNRVKVHARTLINVPVDASVF